MRENAVPTCCVGQGIGASVTRGYGMVVYDQMRFIIGAMVFCMIGIDAVSALRWETGCQLAYNVVQSRSREHLLCG